MTWFQTEVDNSGVLLNKTVTRSGFWQLLDMHVMASFVRLCLKKKLRLKNGKWTNDPPHCGQSAQTPGPQPPWGCMSCPKSLQLMIHRRHGRKEALFFVVYRVSGLVSDVWYWKKAGSHCWPKVCCLSYLSPSNCLLFSNCTFSCGKILHSESVNDPFWHNLLPHKLIHHDDERWGCQIWNICVFMSDSVLSMIPTTHYLL